MSEERMREMVERIKIRRIELCFSFQDLADRTGMSKSTLQRYESGAIKSIPLDKLEVLASALELDPVAILGYPEKHAPLYEAAAGQGRINGNYASDTFDGYALKEDEVLVSVKGDSMYPTLQDGDIVVVKQQNVLSRNGQIALVKINGDEAVLKRIEQKSNGVVLISDNANSYPPRFFTDVEVGDLPVCIEGVVVRLIRDL